MPIGFGCLNRAPWAWGLMVAVALGLPWPAPADGWGLEAHVLINRAACTTVPGPLRRFFMRHQAFIGEHGKDPDTVFTVKEGEAERMRHWFDLDELDRFPFRNIPRNYEKALAKYGRERMKEAGLLPWRIAELDARLVQAMRESDWKRVPLFAAHLGHYVADGHQPLHTRAQRTADPVGFTFDFLIDSYVWVDNLLRADTLARHGVHGYHDAYYAALYVFAGKLAKLSMAQAATDLGSFWYSAWIDAGRPKVP